MSRVLGILCIVYGLFVLAVAQPDIVNDALEAASREAEGFFALLKQVLSY